MCTGGAISEIGLFDMSYRGASCVWVFKIGISIVIRDHLGIPFYVLASCAFVFPSRSAFSNQTAEKGFQRVRS